MTKKANVETTAEAYLELLAARGVDYFFGNAGTDFAPIIEAYTRRRARGQLLPRPVTVPHEVPAVAMAHGYAMVTGRPQAVMVHVIVGTANALGGVINAARGGVPMLFTAGRNPITEAGFRGSRERQIHWAQESFDQGAIVREFVKWDYELRNFAQLETVVDRALAVTQAEPQAPVYLARPTPERRGGRGRGGGGSGADHRDGEEPRRHRQGPRARPARGRGDGEARRGGGAPRRRSLPHPRELSPGPSAARGVRRDAVPRHGGRDRGGRVRRALVPTRQEPAAGDE